jgi:squalene synthase HpnC
MRREPDAPDDVSMSARENFPVGSILIRRDLRPAVAAFYRFARAADDVADDPALSVEAKLEALARFDAGLEADGASPEGASLRGRLAALDRLGAVRHARQLLEAFRRDARGVTYRDWPDLLAYCEDSANPVGRFLLDLHGESPAGRDASDALCTALQVLNHLQDLRADRDRLDRVYLPAAWIAAEGACVADLSAERMTPALARAVGRALERCDALLDAAEGLPDALASRRLAGEARTTLHLARRLAARLRREDPLAGRVAPSRLDFALGAALGAWRAAVPPTRRPPLDGRRRRA